MIPVEFELARQIQVERESEAAGRRLVRRLPGAKYSRPTQRLTWVRSSAGRANPRQWLMLSNTRWIQAPLTFHCRIQPQRCTPDWLDAAQDCNAPPGCQRE